MPVLDRTDGDDGVVLVRWIDGDNRVNTDSMAEWHELLDDLEGREGPLALIVTGNGKFFSNGLDLDRFASDPAESGAAIRELHRLFGRLLVLPAYTVAAINGHAFAAGAMLSGAFDHRLMRSDRGYWCLPEVDLGLPLSDAMHAVLSAHLPRSALIEASLTGRRFTGAEAHDAGIVHGLVSEDELLGAASAAASAMADKDRTVIGIHKRQLFGPQARTCLRIADEEALGLPAPPQ